MLVQLARRHMHDIGKASGVQRAAVVQAAPVWLSIFVLLMRAAKTGVASDMELAQAVWQQYQGCAGPSLT